MTLAPTAAQPAPSNPAPSNGGCAPDTRHIHHRGSGRAPLARPRRLALALSALLVLGLLAPAAASEEDPAAEDDSAFPTAPFVVGTQRAGTFGDDAEVGTLGTELGADLREARITMPDAETVVFEIVVEKLPTPGGTPEVIRYTWDMLIDGKVAQIDGKFTNYSRGICDPTSGQCDPAAGKLPRDPGQRPFFFRGNLNAIATPATTFNAMEELAVIAADFDVATKTITVEVPVEVIDLLDGVTFGPCSKIAPGAGLRGGVVEASLAAFLTSGAFPHDDILAGRNGTFVAPPADAEVGCTT